MDKLHIFVLGICTIASASDAATSENCLLLEVAIGDYIRGTMAYANVIYNQMGAEGINTDADSLDHLKGTSGYDLRIQKELHQFACKLAETNNRDGVAEVFGVTRDAIDMVYDVLLEPIDGPDRWGLYGVLQVSQIMLDLLKWGNRTGYPIIPFNIDKVDTLNTYKKVQFGLKYSPAARKALDKVPFPLALSPQEAVKFLSAAETSYDQLEKDMKLEIGSLYRYARLNRGNPQAVTAAILDVETSMNFLVALDKTRILYF